MRTLRASLCFSVPSDGALSLAALSVLVLVPRLRWTTPTIARWLATVGTPRNAGQLNGCLQLNGSLWLTVVTLWLNGLVAEHHVAVHNLPNTGPNHIEKP